MSNDQPIYNHTGDVPHPHEAPVTGTDAFLDKYFKKIVLAAIVAAAGVTIAGLVKYKNNLTAIEAGQLVSSAKTVEDCDLVVQKYPGSTAAGNALLFKADLQWKSNKKDTAVGTLREFTKNFPKHPFYVSGLIGLASKLETSGEKAEAKAIYERVSSEFGKSEFAPMAQIRLGDMLWAEGKDEEAKKFFEDLPSKYPGELTVSMSQSRLDLISAGLPTKEVDGPPAPKKVEPAAPTTPPISPGGLKPINLSSGLGTSTPVSVPAAPSATLTPQGTAVTNPAISITPTKPAPPSLPPVTPTDLKAPPAVKKVEPGTPPAVKVEPPAPSPATPALPPVKKELSVPPAPPSTPAPSTGTPK